MGLPALQSIPQAPAELPIPDDSGVDSCFYAPGPAFDLRTVVEAVFDPTEDRVIYEAARASVAACDDACLFLAAGTGLSAGSACAGALERLVSRRYVVVVGSDGAFTREMQEELPALLGIRRRFAIVWPYGSGPLGLDSQLAAARWRVIDLRGGTEARTVAKALLVARYTEQPTLIVVDPVAVTALSRREAQLWTTSSLPVSDVDRRDTCAELVEALRDQLARDPRLAAVIVMDDLLWRSLEQSSGASSTVLRESQVERGLTMGVGLSHAGCRPVIVVSEAALAVRPAALREILGGRRFRGIVIVVQSDRGDAVRIECPEELAQRTLTPGAGAPNVRQELDQVLSSPAGVVWHVHQNRIVADDTSSPSGVDGAGAAPDDTVVMGRPASVGGVGRDLRPARPAGDAGSQESAARQIREYRFNPWQQKWVDEYSAIGNRDVYLWRWTGRAVEWLTLSCVAPEWRESVCDTKFLAAMFNVLLDDLVDERGDLSAMDDVVSLMGDEPGAFIKGFGAYGEFVGRVWSEIRRRVREYPREAEFRRLLSYDFRQLCNQVDYSGLLHRHPHLINQTEHDLYSPHGMMVACTATLDLTCSPGFRNEDLGTLREAVWHANSMARIGNLVTTWQREIGDDDFSSGVFARAVSLGRLQADELSSANRSVIESAIVEAGIEQEFAERWRTHRQRLIELAPRARSVSLLGLLDGLERLLASEYASRGRK